jgi:hypothetical protein
LWKKNRGADGYGLFRVNGKTYRAHRVAYQIRHEINPNELHVLHSCDTPLCVNPDHLWVGTNAENMADRNRKGRQASGDRAGARTHPEKYVGLRVGEKNPRAKLTECDVRAIRENLALGSTQKSLAVSFGVSTSTISFIALGQTWRVKP